MARRSPRHLGGKNSIIIVYHSPRKSGKFYIRITQPWFFCGPVSSQAKGFPGNGNAWTDTWGLKARIEAVWCHFQMLFVVLVISRQESQYLRSFSIQIIHTCTSKHNQTHLNHIKNTTYIYIYIGSVIKYFPMLFSFMHSVIRRIIESKSTLTRRHYSRPSNKVL